MLIARRKDQAKYPQAWEELQLALYPGAGPSGNRLYDFSGRDIHGTLTNGPTWVDAQGSKAILCDASNDFISLPARQIITEKFTLSWWERITANTNGYPARFRLTYGARSFAVLRSTDGTYGPISFGEWRGFPGVRASNATSIIDAVGVWAHFTLVSLASPSSNNVSDWRLYENGISRTLSTSGSFSPQSSVNQIGWDSLDNGADCQFSDILIHGRPLPIDEVKLLALRPGIIFEPKRRVFYSIASSVSSTIFRRSLSQRIGSRGVQ